ncbi:hypothetical protein CTAYLR_006419 [Chrysophaeum taylorii]|uniref:Large ribosomal subunit protein uL3m n=1 Tax=Chrysophaeum taylorii TaxID=2483200 RepID=A0AAD7UBB6_9STRA|nr:hypothetical protein CTAYLR_006419 [Chrysophaeum taylorii]
MWRTARRWTQSNGTPSVRRAEVPYRRTGVLAVKAGMMGTWDQFGKRHALTLLHVDGCRVVQVKDVAKEGYTAVQVGAGTRKVKHVDKAKVGHFRRWWGEEEEAFRPEMPYALSRRVSEFRVSPDAILPVGTRLGAAHFVPGQFVDVQGKTRGKGFAGPMKRWGFGGGPASHGTSKAHRTHGSMGGCQDPGRVFKGKKMAGRMGGRNRTAQNLVVHKVDTERNVVYVRGAVPGAQGGWVRITDAIRHRDDATMQPTSLGGKIPFPTVDPDIALPRELEWHDEPPPRLEVS